MKKTLWIVLFYAGALFAQNELLPLQKQIYFARDQVLPALVHVEPIKKVYSYGEKQHALVTGSGVIFSPDGYVLTNHHVAGDAEKVWCTLSNKKRITATVVGSDPSTDIAVLRLSLEDLDEPSVPYARLGNSDSLIVGEIVLAMGSPLGLSRSISMGVISSIDRYFASNGSMLSPYNLWIQTDAAINPGNSGGPLINLQGEVIGINARAVFLAENLGFAIPINLAKEVAEKIIKGSTIKRSWLGMELRELKDFREYLGRMDFQGVLITHVEANSPASKAGIRPGDVLQRINNIPIHASYEEDLPAIRKTIAGLPIGERITLHIWRNGKQMVFETETIEEPFIEEPEFEVKAWGIVVKGLTWSIYQSQMLPDYEGVYITSVKPGGAAELAQLQEGDVIRKINGQPVKNLKIFRELYNELLDRKEAIFLELIRYGYPYFAVIQPQLTP
ncbi:MAG: PDZ domain-containing protein [Calditrichaeota bacterium]|nr:MAG: PDZ domain-containing protein [Calditrichota bacterium]